jgi:ammonia channel protein AmtB
LLGAGSVKPPSTKTIVNLLYHSAVLSGLTVGYAMLGKTLFRFNVGSPTNANLKDALKLSTTVTTAIATKDYLEKLKILPIVDIEKDKHK